MVFCVCLYIFMYLWLCLCRCLCGGSYILYVYLCICVFLVCVCRFLLLCVSIKVAVCGFLLFCVCMYVCVTCNWMYVAWHVFGGQNKSLCMLIFFLPFSWNLWMYLQFSDKCFYHGNKTQAHGFYFYLKIKTKVQFILCKIINDCDLWPSYFICNLENC